MSEQPEDFVRAAFPSTLKERDAEEAGKLKYALGIAADLAKKGFPPGIALYAAMRAVFGVDIFS